jgi:hypothetical protein
MLNGKDRSELRQKSLLDRSVLGHALISRHSERRSPCGPEMIIMDGHFQSDPRRLQLFPCTKRS